MCAAGLALGITGCGQPKALQETRHPTGSQSITTSSDYSALYVANTHDGSLSRLSANSQQLQELELDGDPTRVAQAQGRVFVTLRTRRAVAVYKETGRALEFERLVEVGNEPVGIVASEDQTRLYVASSLSGQVVELDASTLEILRRWTVEDEPRWLALHPGGTLYVASAWQGTLTYIDLGSGDVHQTRLPERKGFLFETGDEFTLHARITGDPAVSADGKYLVVPAMYVDNQNPIATVEELNEGEFRGGEGGGYSSDRFTPVVAVIPVGGGEKPKVDDAQLVTLASFSSPEPVTGYASSVAVDPTSALVYATIEGAGAVVSFSLEVAEPKGGVFDNFLDDGDSFDNFEFRNNLTIATAAGPRGIVFTSEDEAFVYSFLDRAVERLDASEPRAQLDSVSGREFIGRPLSGRTSGARAASLHTLPIEVELGRQLFYSTRDSRMSQQGSGVSCALCHFDGRTDGITWTFTTGRRQTPSLAGQVSLTEPVRWEGDRATVAEDARFTSQSLMGGSGVADEELDALAAFIDWTPDVDSPLKGSQDAQVARGQALFERSDVGCANCHSGARYTDNTTYSMFGLRQVQTRSLVGVAGSPPYLHDGSSPTLLHLLERVRSGEMGNTAALSDADLEDLQAYLRSL